MYCLALMCCIISLGNFYASEAKPYDGSRRCVNMWDEGCINGQLPGAGGDDDYLNGGFNPGKRCLNEWGEGCDNGRGTGGDDGYYLGGGFASDSHTLYDLLAKLQKKHKLY